MTTFRIREAAELLGVSDDTVRRWADAGLTLAEQRALELQGQEHRRGQALVGEVAHPVEGIGDRLGTAGVDGQLGSSGGCC